MFFKCVYWFFFYYNVWFVFTIGVFFNFSQVKPAGYLHKYAGKGSSCSLLPKEPLVLCLHCRLCLSDLQYDFRPTFLSSGKNIRSWCDGSSDRSFMVDPWSDISFQPVLHNWYNKGRIVCYPVCEMMHIKEPLLLIRTSSPCGRFLLSLFNAI